ncbi:MAG TPA: phage holin family protein [Oxalicibacterium sp.]|nr:phage holin family protein [Oxalicibacterium sp.]
MEPHDARQGLIADIGDLARNLYGLLSSRIELAAVELTEIRNNVLKMVALFALAVVFAFFAIGCWLSLLVYLSWDALGWKILLIVAAACTAIVLAIVAYVMSLIRKGGLSMPATMEELRNDQDALL